MSKECSTFALENDALSFSHVAKLLSVSAGSR